MINRPKPISQQVKELLWERIHQGEFDQDGRLPSEEQLARDLAVSRATVRTALSELARDGLITRKHGDGTYVNRYVMEISTSLTRIWDFQHLIIDSGRTPSVKFLSYSSRKPTKQEISLFDLDVETEFYVLERLFWADSTPVIYSINLFPTSVLCASKEEVRFDLPIHEFLSFHCDQKIGYSITNLSAVEAPEKLEKLLNIPKDKPVLQFVDQFFNLHDEILMYGHNYYNDKVLRIRLAKSWG